ncbi:hypothetical protein SLEP1_g39465 [Rubroshorea leprosula]|uniref:Uncharacterized protein n=1 Tax=Rubroshorea leprosula TaxID=152421 RepID=A0AAV5L0K0_9ROSI|nr:hypothetical protein SLEP1_g39465 [Rubroshorea leprosula]
MSDHVKIDRNSIVLDHSVSLALRSSFWFYAREVS